MQERRKSKRRFIMYYTRIFDRGTGAIIGYFIDLSPDGAMLVSEAPFVGHKLSHLRMDVPEEFDIKACLDFEATCVWCRTDTADPRFYESGFHLQDVPAEDIALIERIIQEYGFRDN